VRLRACRWWVDAKRTIPHLTAAQNCARHGGVDPSLEGVTRLEVVRRLAESEERYRSLIAAMSDGVVLRYADGDVGHCNAAAERILGVTVEQLTGRAVVDPLWRTVREDGSELPTAQHPSARTLASGEAHRDVVVGVHKPDGELTWISVTAEPLFAPGDKKPYAALCAITDITERRAIAQALIAHAAEQEALRTVATLVASETQPRAVFAAAAKHAAHVLDAITGAVFRLEPTGEARMVGAWSSADLPSLPIGEFLDLAAPTATAAVLHTGTSAVASYEIERAGLRSGPTMPLRSGAAAPIEVDGRLWGIVSVAWGDASASDPEVLPRLAHFADLVSLAVTGAEAREQLALFASTDHLTGLSNERTFSERLDEEVRRARRHQRPLSLVLIDLDHFKLVNDTHGHDTGNRALAELAERLTSLRRGGEVLARIGGEEFAWILPETDGSGALGAAERARIAITGAPFPGIGRLTISAGTCSLDEAQTARELYRHADLALYWAKSLGRNTIFRYAPETLGLMPPDEQASRLEHAKTLSAVRALASAVDAKDGSTQRHSERVATLACKLALVAGWDSSRISLLHDASLVHDVGKIGIPDHILLKPGRLTDAEFEQIKPHAALGARMVDDLLSPEQVGWIRHHHERFDGTGYPDCLSGTLIPEGARLLAIADAWDAMTVARPYGAPRSIDDALEECRRSAGGQLWPEGVAALESLHEAGALATLDAT
jgi:diguanylate cyclase (GGDEF)-like protein/PAS domain S-box-containing protein